MKKEKNINSKISIFTYKHPRLLIIASMILLNVFILFVAAIIAVIIDPEFTGLIDALANGSIKWLLTPNAILEITNPATLVLATCVLITGMILFSGTIIAITTNILKEYFEKKSSNKGKINLNNHILILNWNNKVPEIISEMVGVGYPITVCILAEKDKNFMDEKINNKLIVNNIKNKSLTLIVKNGNPLLIKNLNDLSVNNVKSILIMSSDIKNNSENELGDDTYNKSFAKTTDMNIIKNILSLSNIKFNNFPHITAEVASEATKEKMLTLKEGGQILKETTLDILCFNRRIAQMLAQTVVQRSIEDIYRKILSFEGSEIYLIKNVYDIQHVLKNYSNCVPILSGSKGTYVLAQGSKVIQKNTNEETLLGEYTFDISTDLNKLSFNDSKLFIIGKSNKNHYLENSFKNYCDVYNHKINYKMFSYEELDELIDEVKLSENSCKVLLLSEDSKEDKDLDTQSINSLLYLRKYLNKDVKIVIELLDPSNKRLIESLGVENTIVSNKIISLLMARCALYPETEGFYDSLLDVGKDYDNENYKIIVKSASEVIPKNDSNLSFKNQKEFINCFQTKTTLNCVPIGYIKEGIITILGLKEDIMKPLTIKGKDRMIFIIKA